MLAFCCSCIFTLWITDVVIQCFKHSKNIRQKIIIIPLILILFITQSSAWIILFIIKSLLNLHIQESLHQRDSDVISMLGL